MNDENDVSTITFRSRLTHFQRENDWNPFASTQSSIHTHIRNTCVCTSENFVILLRFLLYSRNTPFYIRFCTYSISDSYYFEFQLKV